MYYLSNFFNRLASLNWFSRRVYFWDIDKTCTKGLCWFQVSLYMFVPSSDIPTRGLSHSGWRGGWKNKVIGPETSCKNGSGSIVEKRMQIPARLMEVINQQTNDCLLALNTIELYANHCKITDSWFVMFLFYLYFYAIEISNMQIFKQGVWWNCDS